MGGGGTLRGSWGLSEALWVMGNCRLPLHPEEGGDGSVRVMEGGALGVGGSRLQEGMEQLHETSHQWTPSFPLPPPNAGPGEKPPDVRGAGGGGGAEGAD